MATGLLLEMDFLVDTARGECWKIAGCGIHYGARSQDGDSLVAITFWKYIGIHPDARREVRTDPQSVMRWSAPEDEPVVMVFVQPE